MNAKAAHERIKQKFIRKIDENKKSNKLKLKGDFLGISHLKAILTTDNIKILLREDFPKMDDELLEEWCLVLRDHRTKTYALLILEDMAGSIDQLDIRDNTLHDEALYSDPFSKPGQYTFPWNPWKLKDKNIASTLEQKQWIVPPRLSSTVHQSFPPLDFKFPFVQEPKMIGSGSFGQVHEISIAEGNIEFSEGFNQSSPIVYKTVRKEEHEGLGWDRLLNEVRVLRARKHKHVTPLLASFTAGNAHAFRPNDSQENLYMIFPRADRNMDEWMQNDPGCFSDDGSRHDYVYQSMINVVSGLAYIHKEIKGKVGFHHDLKPANILQFANPDGSMPVWKICDFGGSNLKHAVGETGTSHGIGSPLYAPPEFYSRSESPHGRTYDMFSLGCILLELATVWKYGWVSKGLPEFTSLRLEHGEKNLMKHPKAFYCNTDVVQRWIDRLKKSDSKKFCQVLCLIEETLVERSQRIFAWEIEVDLFWCINPDTPFTEILDRLRNVAQEPRKRANAITYSHNPLMRATRRRPYRAEKFSISPEEDEQFLAVLRGLKWSTNDPGSTEALRVRAQQSSSQVEYFSTLEVPKDASPLYGRHEESERIEKQFATRNVIGLFGLPGIGKSHLALHYALQFKNTRDERAKKHTFWVHADCVSSIIASYMDIAATVPNIPADLQPEDQCRAVRNWLEDTTNGPWIMVVDGVDSPKTAKAIRSRLPKVDSGQLIITGRDRGYLGKVCDWNMPCLEVQKPTSQDCLKIFRYHLVDSYYDEDVQDTRELLERLWLPLVIKMGATYMNEFKYTNRTMCEKIKNIGVTFDHIKEFDRSGTIMKLFLGPLFVRSDDINSTSKSDGWSLELRLLCFLACLSKDRIGIELIRANYRKSEHAAVDTRLRRLMNCAFIECKSDNTYGMHKFVQDAVVAWMRDQKKELGLFQRLEIALGALHKRYKEKTKKDDPHRAALMHRSSYAWKIPFMPHFARFVEFTHEAREKGLPSDFKFNQHAMDSIDTFSKFYLEQGRYEAAIEVLKFAQSHHNGELKSKISIGKKLAQAYLSRASTEPQMRHYWQKAEILLLDLKNEADEGGMPLAKWELILELVRLYGLFNECESAWKYVKSMSMFRFRIRNGEAEPKFEQKLDAFPQWKDVILRKRIHMIMIRLRYEEGLVHLATGHINLGKRRKYCAAWSWRAAKIAFLESTQALQFWLHNESEFLIEIEDSIAEVNCQIGTKTLLREAEDMLNDHIRQLRENHVSNKRIWDTKCRLAAVFLQENNTKAKDAIQMLEPLVESYSQLFGRSNGETLQCVQLLGKAYLAAGLRDNARRMAEDYDCGLEIANEQPEPSRMLQSWFQIRLSPSLFPASIVLVGIINIAITIAINTYFVYRKESGIGGSVGSTETIGHEDSLNYGRLHEDL